jgi:hypothetical protein
MANHDHITSAVSGPNPDAHLATIITDMEDDLRKLESFATVVRHMGQCNENPPAEGVFVVGEALEDIAASIRSQWDEAFRLSHPTGGVQ